MIRNESGTLHFMRHAPTERQEIVRRPPGAFAGWISREWGVSWVISQERSDKRTGKRLQATEGVRLGKERGHG